MHVALKGHGEDNEGGHLEKYDKWERRTGVGNDMLEGRVYQKTQSEAGGLRSGLEEFPDRALQGNPQRRASRGPKDAHERIKYDYGRMRVYSRAS